MSSFEILTMREGRWLTSTIVEKEDSAKSIAQRLFNDRKCEGVKILSVIERPDGTSSEKEIYIRTRSAQEEDTVSVSQVDYAPRPCESTEEFFNFDSRLLINRLFRSYLDTAVLTPTEILYDTRELKRLEDKGGQLIIGIDRVSTLQARLYGADSKIRKDQLNRSVEAIRIRAIAAEKLALPTITGKFSEAIAKLPKSDESVDYLAVKTLAKDMLGHRNWPQKLERLCKLALNEPDAHALELIDGVIADVLGSNVVQDILGYQPNLGTAICRMIDLAEGVLPESPNDAGEATALLNSLFAMNNLPVSKACLVERAHRQIRATTPLSRNQPDKEQEVFRQVVERLLLPSGLYDGTVTAEALTKRYGRFLNFGGAEGYRKSISGAFRLMPDKVAGIIYLCEMMKLPSTQDYMDEVNERFEDIMFTRHISDLCIKGLSGRDRLIRATGAYYAVQGAPLPDKFKTKLMERIDAIIDRFLVDEQIIDKMNDPSIHLRDRTSRLIQFCSAGVLPPEGKAITRAKSRVIELLRQPNFEEHFIEGITDPNMIQQTLRLLDSLLTKAGLKG